MANNFALKSDNGALWVQPEGPNTEPLWLSCFSADDITNPGTGRELIQCFDALGNYQTVGFKRTPPEPISTTLTGLSFATRNWLDKIRGPFGLYLLQRDGGRADGFGNWQRATILQDAEVGERTISNVLHRSESNETERGYSITAFPPLIDVVRVNVSRVGASETRNALCVSMLPEETGALPARYGVLGCSAGVSAKGNIYYTTDGGATWNLCSALPFANNESVAAIAIFAYGRNSYRILAVKEAPSGGQGEVAYSDDFGATWTNVNLGGATAGHGATGANALCVLNERNIWLASAAGYIYRSTDGGASWEEQDAGVLTSNDYSAVHFIDDQFGVATGKSGIVAVTTDGGRLWSLATAPSGAPDINTVHVLDGEHIWAGDDGGNLHYSNDYGETWNVRAHTGSGSGSVKAVAFVAGRYVGYMLRENGAGTAVVMRTIDGGYTWEAISTPPNSGANALAVIDPNTAYAVGDVNSGTALLLDVSD